MSRFPLEKVDTQCHAIAVKSVRIIQLTVMREQLLPDNMSEMGKKRRILLPLPSLVIHARIKQEGR